MHHLAGEKRVPRRIFGFGVQSLSSFEAKISSAHSEGQRTVVITEWLRSGITYVGVRRIAMDVNGRWEGTFHARGQTHRKWEAQKFHSRQSAVKTRGFDC